MISDFSELIDKAIELGANKAAIISVDDIPFEPQLRDACKQNYCGAYGKNWTCPPLVGDVEVLIDKVKSYKSALVFQLIGDIEDSYDIEGMNEVKELHNVLLRKLAKIVKENFSNALILGAGGCTLCDKCAAVTNEPCRIPDEAYSSVEAHGIFVTKLAEVSNMKYINGQNTVTYFGMILV